jgi:hypothetical protein
VWCDRAWTPFVPFGSPALTRSLPSDPGLYRVRVAGRDELAYVGQTGRDVKQRAAALARGTLAAEMPWNDPHTAAPKLWSYRHAEGLAYEASGAACALADNDRIGTECYLVWRYRLEAGRSPLCNFGRLHPRYTTARNRGTGVRGRRLDDGEPDNGGGASLPGLVPRGTPGAADWMGLAWSPVAPLTAAAVGASVPAGSAGLYQLVGPSGDVAYIGQSAGLRARLVTHARSGLVEVYGFSFTVVDPPPTGAQLLELESDLIAAHVAQTGHAPALQFGLRSEPPGG